MAVLELKNIRKSYFLGKEEFPVLKGINLEFERGDFVSLLGESGGGRITGTRTHMALTFTSECMILRVSLNIFISSLV